MVQFCTFQLGGLLFGVEVAKVQEIVRFHQMTRVPLAPPVVAGLLNLRGQIITAMDLGRRLEMPPKAEVSPLNVVVKAGDGLVSLQVEQIGEVLDVSDEKFERPPETLKGIARELIRGAYKLEDRLLLILDVEKAVNLSPSRKK